MPRAIAPLVTSTTSSPAWCTPAAGRHTERSTAVRSSPASSATMLEPSFTTVAPMRPQPRQPPARPLSGRRAGIQLERDARDLHLVAGLEALALQGIDQPQPAQAALQIAERVLVVEV